jgi:spore germination cell wall hydrolase CwlJ-like protein
MRAQTRRAGAEAGRPSDAAAAIVRRAHGRPRLKNDRTGLAIIAAALPMPLVIVAMIAAQASPARTPATSRTSAQAHDAKPASTPAKRTVLSIAIPDRADAKTVSAGYSRAELRCLARAVYFEAGHEPLEGQVAIAEVVIARSQDPRWKGDLCSTIRQPNQFSFVKGGRTTPIEDPTVAQTMMDLVRRVATGKVSSRAKGALYYHADYSKPVWRHALAQKIRIKTHIFYTDPVAST